MNEIIGWIGTVCLSCCGIPQIIIAFKYDIATKGISWFYLSGWIIGIICMLVYIHSRSGEYQYPLQVANLISLSCAVILSTMKYRRK